jgi:hypothetical protein
MTLTLHFLAFKRIGFGLRDEEGGKFVRVSLGDECIGSRRSVEEADPVLPSGDRDRSPEEREAELPASDDERSSQRDQCTARRV